MPGIHHITAVAALLVHLLSCDSSRIYDPEGITFDAYSAEFEIPEKTLRMGHFERADSLINVLVDHARQTGNKQQQIRASELANLYYETDSLKATDASLTQTDNELLRRELAYSSNINRKQNQVLAILSAGIFVAILLLIIAFRSRRKLSHTHEILTSQAAEISRKNRQLQQLNRDNDTLVSVIVHDLRNPLSGLLGAIELVQMSAGTDEESAELLSLAYENGKRLKYQIDELLEVTSIDKKNISGETEVIPVQATVRDVLKIYRHTADKKSIRIDEQLQPLFVSTHKDYLVRIIDNLVTNAIKYSPCGALISVNTSFIGASYWQLEVHDQGPGFNDRDKENLFKLFGRLSGKPTGNEESTGLGLYTVKMLVDKLNGTVSLISEPGKGSTFICRFPGVADADPVLSNAAGEAVV